MAAEAYARIDNTVAAVCVTTGPGATNAITGVVCGWMDSIPMLVFSGQARYATTVRASGLKLRTKGIQEFDIIGSVRNLTKYCELVEQPSRIRYCLEKAFHLARHGRPGPCWLDIPLDVQSAEIEPDSLDGYVPCDDVPPPSDADVKEVLRRIRLAERPAAFIGNGVRLSGAHEQMLALLDKLNIPVVTGMGSIDAVPSNHPLYIGRNGTTGDRAGNFVVQNADLLLSLGGRLSYYQTGYNKQEWGKKAYKIINDIDGQELEKDSIFADMKLCCDVKALIAALSAELKEPLPQKEAWLAKCRYWKENYPVVLPKHYADAQPNIYCFFKEMTQRLTGSDRLVVSCGTSRVAGSQASVIHPGMRFITNPATASMGYDLPAAIGVCVANRRRKTVLVTGEGSLQMNLQELQTIVQNRFPICIFVMNNGGYHSIRMTQRTYFKDPLVGVGEESGDLSFPDLSKLIPAYGIDFLRCETMEEMIPSIEWALAHEKACVCEMMLSTKQVTEPKVASRRSEDGKFLSAALEDMAPFLTVEELEENMAISRSDFEKTQGDV